MTAVNATDAWELEQAVDPNSRLYQDLLGKLLKPRAEEGARADRLRAKGDWVHMLPFRADPETELEISKVLPFRFAERGLYVNGAKTMAATFDAMIDVIAQASGRMRIKPTLVVSGLQEMLYDTVVSSGAASTLVHYCGYTSLYEQLVAVRPNVMVVDHTSLCVPVDEVLNLAFDGGVEIVDGVFPYHVGALRGWDVGFGFGGWSVTHTAGYVIVGPDDDPSRIMRYSRDQYEKFTDPSKWVGKCKQYLYEIRRYAHGLATYRAVYVGDQRVPVAEDVSFKLPVCSSDDMVLVTVNRELASGVYVSHTSNAWDLDLRNLPSLDKNYAIEVRKDLFNPCVEYLVGQVKGADISGDAIRYITQHNYVDLQDGVRVIRKAALSYADALCVAMVCALVAFELRYRLTNESLPVIQQQAGVARWRNEAPLGALGRLVWLAWQYVRNPASTLVMRSLNSAINALYTADYIPGVCYEVYMDRYYRPHAHWFESWQVHTEVPDVPAMDLDHDPFVSYLGDAERAYAPNLVKRRVRALARIKPDPYTYNPIADPAYTVQSFYDEVFPGNSTAQIQNVAELRRTRDININTEFYGKIMIGKDISAPEKLHDDAPVRTTALPVSRTNLVDAILASAKRNWNPPDMQMESDVWAYADKLTDQFIEFAFVPNFRDTLQRTYDRDRVSFNVCDYIAWRAGKDGNYRKMLDDECPNEMVELELNRYDTIIKKRVKPKLSLAAQHELGQGQVIVGMSKKDTALFTSVFRVMFERFDGALRPEICSAGRLSDEQISDWLTDNLSALRELEAIEMDSSKYDKSQGLLARMIEAYVFIKLGLDPGVMEIFADSYVGRVSSKVLGIMFMSAYQMKSGAPQTMLGNLIYNFVSAITSIGAANISHMIAKGDDNVIWLKKSVVASLVVAKMSNLFNLETKLLSAQVIVFSSGFVLFFEEFGYFVPDLTKVVELLGERGHDPRTRTERWRSFADRVSIYAAYRGIPEVVQGVIRWRYDAPNVDAVAAIDAVLTIASSLDVYSRVVPD